MAYRISTVHRTTNLPAAASQSEQVFWYVLAQRALYHAVGGVWERIYGGDPSWAKQAAWFIDAVAGDDNNVGSALFPIRSHAELEKRLGVQTLSQSTDITIVGGLAASDPINIPWFMGTGFDLRYLQGAADTVNATGTITAVTAINRATNTPQSIEASALGSTWTALGLVGKKIVLTSGASSGAVGWVAKDLGGGNNGARLAPFGTLSAIPSNPTVITPTVGNTFEVRTSPQITLGRITGIGPGNNIVFNRFEIEFNSISTILASLTNQIILQECGQVGFYFSVGINNLAWRASKLLSQSIAKPGAFTVATCLIFAAISLTSAGISFLISGDTLVQGAVGGGPGLGAITATDYARITVSSAGTFDATGVSITVQRMAGYRASGAHYGSGSVTQLSIENAVGYYSVLPTAVGTTQDMLLGGRARAFNATPAQLPWTDGSPLGSFSAFVLGGVAASPVSSVKTAAYSARFGEHVRVDPTAGGFTVTLPTITAAWPDAEVTITNTSSSANVVVIAAAGGQTVNGAASINLGVANGSRVLRSDGGTNWFVVAAA